MGGAAEVGTRGRPAAVGTHAGSAVGWTWRGLIPEVPSAEMPRILELAKWGRGRAIPLVMLAQEVAVGAEAYYEACLLARRREPRPPAPKAVTPHTPTTVNPLQFRART